ncbi:TlpA disulfide reductase family protein [Desulfotomaculum nigrificans]|uniref:TlpA disulfide reductase family protein n=1 Tax=Desulfotomaculum nigrificans TaxID=1565 RepID=UPI0001FAE9D8|nr:TlpA disulfide reductase family protein [Desulfotomaculum nigrificans]
MSRKNKIMAVVLLLALVLGGAYYLKTGNAAKQENQVANQDTKETKTETVETTEATPAPVMAPDFTLEDINGKQVRLSDLRGKKVLINFWTTWCKYCRVEMPELQKFYEQTKDKNWQILAVNITRSERSISDVKDYLKTNNFTFPVLLDKTGQVADQYGINSIPTSFILNEKGEVIQTKMGPFSQQELTELAK